MIKDNGLDGRINLISKRSTDLTVGSSTVLLRSLLVFTKLEMRFSARQLLFSHILTRVHSFVIKDATSNFSITIS